MLLRIDLDVHSKLWDRFVLLSAEIFDSDLISLNFDYSMITPFSKKAISSRSTQRTKRFHLRFFVALAFMFTCSGCQWMYTDTGEPAATKDKFLWNDTKPKSSRNTFNMTGLSDESQQIEKNLGGR